MFLYLIDYLGSISSSFYVFEYITLRAILSIITALVISLLIGPVLIKKFSLGNISEVIRSDGPESHQKKIWDPNNGWFVDNLFFTSEYINLVRFK